MVNKESYIVLLLVVIGLIGCNKERVQNSLLHQIDINSNTINSTDEYIKSINITELDSSESALINFRDYKKVIFSDSLIYIQDRGKKRLFGFNYSGKLELLLNKAGRGPGEYLYIGDIDINPYNQNIEIVDERSHYTYDKHGNFIEKNRIIDDQFSSANEIAIIDSSHIAFASFYSDQDIVIYDRIKKRIDRRYSIFPKWTRRKIPLSGRDAIRRVKLGEVRYFRGFSNKIYTITKDSCQLSYEWDFGEANFRWNEPPLKRIFLKNDNEREFLQKLDNGTISFDKYVRFFYRNIESEQYIYHTATAKERETHIILYSKVHHKYKIIKGEFAKHILRKSPTSITGNRLYVLVPADKIKRLDKERCFTEDQKKRIRELEEDINPILLTIELSDTIFE